MQILRDVSLQAYNTFGIHVKARQFLHLKSEKEMPALGDQPVLVLGGGSNLLFTDDYPGLVIRNEVMGRTILERSNGGVLVEVGGGENWHQLVRWTLEQGFGGLENLSLIPGSVGAAPVQNIGAYGVELQDVFHSLDAVELASGRLLRFDREACHFGYRNSIFKNELKGEYLIARVRLHLPIGEKPNISYGAIAKTLEEAGITDPSPLQVSDAVISIRQSKLPDPALLGNAGSFFKNPVVDAEKMTQLKEEFPNIVAYQLPENQFKVPAGWLIEQAGWKGKRVGETGAYARQALVLVNYGKATGKEIWEHAQRIARSVEEKFGIQLEPEVNVLP